MMHAFFVAALALQQQAMAVGGLTSLPVDTAGLRHNNGRTPPFLMAVRASAGTPRIDGRLDDAAWAQATPVTGFTQYAPRDGEPATERTEVRVLYDAEAIYVAARMYESEPARIMAQLGRRDAMGQSDFFEVDFDSYHDHRTSFQFYVNPLGVKMDIVASNDAPQGDVGWDPVWDAAATRDSLGWTAELRIPLSQLRFPNAAVQTWGVNFYRNIQRKGEQDFWAYFSQTDQGYASFFGHLLGLENLPQPRRLELLPYATGVEERTAAGAPGNPFNDGSREVGRFGLDLKYGLTSNLTLNGTVNPDFGQVEADPAEVNLTAYETYFSERRPFFVEGANIFSTASPGFVLVSGPQYLYSRRIGRAPQASAVWRGDSAFTDQPTSTTILGAAKLTGRTAGGWSVGLLDAVTAREFASVDSAGVRFRDEVEPLTNYGVLRAKRDFGNGASSLGFMATAVNRRIDDSRLDRLRTSAYAGGADFSHRFGRGRYSLFAALGYSAIHGDTLAIRAAQQSSARYYQRPDNDHVTYDPTRTSLTGWNAAFGASKDQGSTNVAFGVAATSPGFEINDLGYQTRADRVTANLWVGHRWTRPGRVFRSASVTASANAGWNFGWDRTATGANAFAYGQFLNFWSVNVGVARTFRAVNDGLLRGGPAGIQPASWSSYWSFQSDYRQKLYGYAEFDYSRGELGAWSRFYYGSLSFRPTSSIAVSAGPSYSESFSAQQYVMSVADPAATATYGRAYIFGEILQRTLDLTTRLNVTLSPTLSFQFYAQPFVATGAYRRVKQLAAPRTTDYVAFADSAALGSLDFSYRSLRGNAVVRWEYRPGSTLFFVWTTSCSRYTGSAAFDAAGDLRRLCQGRSDNVFAVKMNYWLSL